MVKVEKNINPVPNVSGRAIARIEGKVQAERPEGVRPNSILVIFDSPGIDFQFSILEFYHNGTHYLPSKTGETGSSYVLDTDRSKLPDPSENSSGKALENYSDEELCGLLYPKLFHGVVMPAYNEWRYRNNLEWGETWNTGDRYDYRPYSIR